MQLVPAGQALSFEVTYQQNNLPVAMSVYDDSGPTPIRIVAPFAMALVGGNTYRGKFTPEAGKSYIIIKAVYTDDSFTTLDEDYGQGSESIFALNVSTPQGCQVIGWVEC